MREVRWMGGWGGWKEGLVVMRFVGVVVCVGGVRVGVRMLVAMDAGG